MSFKSKLYNILTDLEEHRRNRDVVIQESIEGRLQKTLDNYNKTIIDSYNYLSQRESFNVMKKLNRRKLK